MKQDLIEKYNLKKFTYEKERDSEIISDLISLNQRILEEILRKHPVTKKELLDIMVLLKKDFELAKKVYLKKYLCKKEYDLEYFYSLGFELENNSLLRTSENLLKRPRYQFKHLIFGKTKDGFRLNEDPNFHFQWTGFTENQKVIITKYGLWSDKVYQVFNLNKKQFDEYFADKTLYQYWKHTK